MFNKRRIPAKQVAKLSSRYRGAVRREDTIKREISKVSSFIRTRTKVQVVRGVETRRKLSTPEVDQLRDKRNTLFTQLTLVRGEKMTFKSDYSKAVKNNKAVSKHRLIVLRKSKSGRKDDNPKTS